MTPFQIVALSILAIVLVVQFVLPNVRLPRTQPDALKYIAQVIAIRDNSTDPKVVDACKALLQVLI
jgi:hypothetical protein